MARNEGFKYWSDQEFVQGFDANAYLMSQSVMRFDNSTDRSVSLARSLVEGMLSYDKSTTTLQLYDGSSWVDVAVGTVGVTDHGALTGLSDDDHSQYHNDTRGDARYYTQTQIDALFAGLSADHGALTGLADDDHTQYHTDARGDARYYTQSQVDSSLSGYLPLSGGTLTGDLTAGSGFITISASTTSEGGELRLDGGTSYSGTYARIDRYGSNLLRFMDGSAVRMSLDITNGNLAVGGSITSGGTAVSLSGHTHSYASTSHTHAYHVAGGDYSTDFVGNQIFADNWFRAKGDTGLYFQDKGTGVRSVQSEGGNYGSVATYGNVGGWEGFSIGGRVVFMHNLSTTWGIYNDVNNEWMIQGALNGGVNLYYNNVVKASTEASELKIHDQITVPNMATTYSYNTVRYNTSNGHLMAYASLRDMKSDITEIQPLLDYLGERSLIYSLRPVIFREADDRVDHKGEPLVTTRGEFAPGFIAEEVHEVAPEITYFDSHGDLISYSNDALIPHLVAELQRLAPMVEELYGAAHPDWVPPSPRPPERAQEERDRYETARQQQAITGIEDPTDYEMNWADLPEEEN